jgi:RNA-binding protein
MIHNISYRVFVYGTENEGKVREAIKTIFPTSLAQKEVTEGHYKNPVLILHDKISEKNDLNVLIENLKAMRSSDKKKILNELKNKIDDKGKLFLRFDKQEAYIGNFKVVEHGDSIHVKLKIAAYPARKEISMRLIRDLLGEGNVF